MAKEKFYKCAFSHCEHPDKKIPEAEAVRIGNRYWHKGCYETSQLIQEIVDDWQTNVSNTVVMSLLRKTINLIVFNKLNNPKLPKYESDLYAARYLNFALQYALNHNIPLKHPFGLHYLIDDKRVKEAWKKKEEARLQKEASKDMDITSESKQTSFTARKQTDNIGFDALFGGTS